MKCYAIENHPNDSRVKIEPDGIVQTLSSRMGTGGNNTPFVLIASTKEIKNESFIMNSSGDGIAAPIDASYYKGQGLRAGIEREYVVMINDSISNDNRSAVCKQPSGELHRSGRIQQYAACDRKEKP